MYAIPIVVLSKTFTSAVCICLTFFALRLANIILKNKTRGALAAVGGHIMPEVIGTFRDTLRFVKELTLRASTLFCLTVPNIP